LAFFDSFASIFGRSPVPSENFALRYEKNGGNAAFLTVGLLDIARRTCRPLVLNAGGAPRHYSCITSA
jgi:hypothetical protein